MAGTGRAGLAAVRADQGRSGACGSRRPVPSQLVGFDPKTEKFFSVNTVSGNIRHMHSPCADQVDVVRTDADKIGRIITTTARS